MSPSTVAILAGAAVAVLALGAWLWYQRWERRRRVQQQLDRLAPRAAREVQGEGDERSALLKDTEGSRLRWLAPLARLLPRRDNVQRLLAQADLDWGTEGFFAFTGGSALAGLAAGLLMAPTLEVALLAGVGAAFLPFFVARRKRARRFRSFEENFPEALELLTRSLRAGHAFATGLEVVADEGQEPVADEFRQIFEEQRYGMPMQETLLAFAERIDLMDVRMFVTSVLIQRETGGNLAEILDNLAGLIRERFKFRRHLRVQTAQGRMTGYILAALPILTGLALYMINPEYLQPLVTEELGQQMLVFALVWQGIGFFIIRRLVDVEF